MVYQVANNDTHSLKKRKLCHFSCKALRFPVKNVHKIKQHPFYEIESAYISSLWLLTSPILECHFCPLSVLYPITNVLEAPLCFITVRDHFSNPHQLNPGRISSATVCAYGSDCFHLMISLWNFFSPKSQPIYNAPKKI